MNKNLNKTVIFIIMILLALISQRISYNIIFWPFENERMEDAGVILKGEASAPYQYRILKPIIFCAADNLLSVFIHNQHLRFGLIVKGFLILVFFFIYLIFFKFLKNFYPDIVALIGVLLLQIVVPLATSDNMREDGDFITLLSYLLAFYLMFKGKDLWIPVIIALGTFNREQLIFIIVFYAAYLLEQKKMFKLKSILVCISSIILYLIVYFGIKQYFGYKTNYYTPLVIPLNTSGWPSILRLWTEQVFVFVFFSIWVFKRSRLFFKYALLSLIPYTILYFFYGVMGELGKFLPAYIVMIAMSLQLFTEVQPCVNDNTLGFEENKKI